MSYKYKQEAENAKNYIIKNKASFIEKFSSKKYFASDSSPVSLFMAGSPGAGKTEFSKRLVEKFTTKPIRIDADEIREFFDSYNGANADIFQAAATKGVHFLYDYALKEKINLILDGTFAYSDAIKNISRSLNKGRKVEIYFLYQDPVVAWEFTKKREAIEHRKVSKEVFISAFIDSRLNVNKAKMDFGDKLELNLVIKNFSTDFEEIKLNIDNIDRFLPKVYTGDNLNSCLLL